jgi:flagellar motor switch protein FliN/FliY
LASDISKVIQDELVNTLSSLLGKSTSVEDVSAIDTPSYNSEQCVKVDVKFEFSSVTTNWNFFIPTHAGTKFEYLMLGGMGDMKDTIDDEIADAVNEIVSNICGSIATVSNAQGYGDLGSTKSETLNNEIVECSTLSTLPNIFNFKLKLDVDEINIAINFDDAILPYINEIRGIESQPEPPATDTTQAQDTPLATSNVGVAVDSDTSLLSSLGENAIDNLKLLFDIKLRLSVRLGTKVFLLKDILRWDIGEIIELEQMVNEPLDILVNGIKIGEGEAVIVDGRFGIKIRSIGSEQDRLNQISLGQ